MLAALACTYVLLLCLLLAELPLLVCCLSVSGVGITPLLSVAEPVALSCLCCAVLSVLELICWITAPLM